MRLYSKAYNTIIIKNRLVPEYFMFITVPTGQNEFKYSFVALYLDSILFDFSLLLNHSYGENNVLQDVLLVSFRSNVRAQLISPRNAQLY